MRFLHIFLLFSTLAGVAFATPVLAQDNVAARTGAHKGYDRLVFDWPVKPEYSLSKDGDRLKIRFARSATLDQAGTDASGNILKIETLSSASEPLQVAVTIPAGSRFRDFIVANKLILDVYDSVDAAKKEPAASAPSVAEKAAEVAETPVTKPAATAPTPTPAATDFTIQPAENAAPAPVTTVESSKVDAPKFEPHAITLTSTTSTGMAVFKRNGMLWMVIDAVDLPSAPQVSGPQKDKLPPLEKLQFPDATAYRMEIPDGMNVYGEGGGLSWRIALTPETRKTTPVSVSADDGKLEWPLKESRKIVTFTDPMVGDTITVITMPSAALYTGPVRNFVELSTLESVIGLAFVAKSDDVKAERTLSAVQVNRPNGLTLSNTSDLRPEQIRQEMEVAPETPAPQPESAPEQAESAELQQLQDEEPAVNVGDLAKAAEEKPDGNNIYNFTRWEMGGPESLNRNMHALMAEISNKGGESNAEDILTMAKLNLANDRGAEALGLLRMALQKVPELEDNAEFNSLRGAALALSYKYDEAIIDFSREGVKKFNDVKYWTAYTLAGLEDWKQAIAVMPQSFETVASYPSGIRTPMVLTFAEIALRGGNVAQTNKILDIMRPDLGALPLPYASYWNYLAGEAARQGGQPDKAIEYWEPLVKTGKDDLFRAKAGLSLTKLLLDEKKTRPAEAVNDLEGLRYAWRGDELETLINFRLGQVYIDNNEFLKGLTVLRNASTLSPGSELNKEVKAYMTRAFRDVFNNDRIRNISPLEAISLYEEFKDLVPQGDESDAYVERLAERLVDSDLLGRAAALLEYQVNNRLQGTKKAEVSIRLAAIRLLDGNPDGALRSLEISQDTLDKLSGEKPDEKTTTAKPDPEKQRQVYLLKARALSMKNETDKAMAILEKMRLDPDVNRLRTDIAWKAGRWEESALALNDLITAEDISARRPLTDYQRDLILNRGIALNLSGNRVALANLRERHNGQMKDTTKGQMFEIITRPRRPDMIGSRQAIDSMISEIDLFKGFLDGYSKMEDRRTGQASTPPASGAAPQAELSTTELPE